MFSGFMTARILCSTACTSAYACRMRLGEWFFLQRFGLDREYGKYPWDDTARLATSMGFVEKDANLNPGAFTASALIGL